MRWLLLLPLLASPWSELGAGSASGGGISSTAGGSEDPTLALDVDGNPYVAWSEDIGGGVLDIYVKRWNGSAWVEVGAGSASGNGISGGSGRCEEPSIALDSLGRPVVAYARASGGQEEVHVRFFNGMAWVPYSAATVSDTPVGACRQVSLAIDAADAPVVAWFDTSSGNSEIYVRRWDGLDWVEIGAGSASGGGISNTPGPSERPRLALDSLDRPVVAWADRATTFEILIKRWDGMAWVDVGSGNVSSTVDSSINPSLALDSSDRPRVAWQEFVSGAFRIYYRAWDGLAWTELGMSATGTGVSGAGFSQYVSLGLDSAGRPALAWADGTQEIFARRWTGAAWEEIGSGSATGSGVSDTPAGDSNKPTLAIDAAGVPIAAWQDSNEIYVRRGVAGPPPPPPPPSTVPGPLGLKQFQLNGQTFAPVVGGATPLDEVVLQGRISALAAEPLRLQVELRDVSIPFTGEPTAEGPLEAPGTETFCVMGPLASGGYHWRARTLTADGDASDWVSFGANPETEKDFEVARVAASTPVVVNDEGGRCGLLGLEALLIALLRMKSARK